ncbi:MAG: UvrD-helicase domain-containing protein [Salinimicrobium sp.]
MKNNNSFTIYDASAGSGKTFTLVKEYLVLLLLSPHSDGFKNILAITFTNKAVAEMKSRIIAALKSVSKEDRSIKDENLLQLLSKETGLTSQEVHLKSRDILKNIIHNYAAFEVSTIDGFTHRVLRTFAKDLDLPLNFEVELRTEDVLREAVDRLISKAGEDKGLTGVLINFVLSKTDDDKSWDISRDLLEIAKLLTQETNLPFLELLKNRKMEDFLELQKKLKEKTAFLETEIVRVSDDFFQLLEDKGLENEDFSRSSCPKFFLKAKNLDIKALKFDLKWQVDLESQPLYPKKTNPAKQDTLDELQPQIWELYSRLKNGILDHQFLQAVEKNIVPLSLLSAIQNEIEAIKQENSVVLISEFNSTIGKTVKDQPAPFIYERLGERYRHYFIDEFQDTSQLQWENLIPLVEHTLSGGSEGDDTGSLTLVGDAKQSIYRWRGGKAEQFMELCGNKNPFNITEKRVLVLPNNYRSAKTIVEFNNNFFKFSSSSLQLEEHRELFNNAQQEPVSEDSGYVNISFIEAENAEEEMLAYPTRVLEIIADLSEKKVSKGDICILTRKKKESIAIANYLNENGISVISAESLLLSRSPEVSFINNILQLSIDKTDKNLKFDVLDYLLGKHPEVEGQYSFLKEMLELEGQAFFNRLSIFGADFQLDLLNSLSVYEGVEYIIRIFGVQKGSNAYLQFFLDFVYETSHSEGAGIFNYLELWERKKEDLSIVVPEGEDAVQIMTIHKAKGLEFPVVIYPFANSPITDVARDSLWLDLPVDLESPVPVALLKSSEKMKEWVGDAPRMYDELCFNSQLDALNVLYVALTRPVQQLYVISKYEVDRKGAENRKKFSGLLISYLKELGKWNEGKEYHFGDPNDLPQQEEEKNVSVKQQEFFSSATESNGISIITRSGMLWDSRQKEAIEKGQLIHDLFAEIASVKDVEQVLIKAREEGRFREQEKKLIENIIFEVVAHPELQQYFSEETISFNEREIVSEKGELLRPDRIVVNGNKISIIDYKTGSEDLKHHEQINSYAEVFTAMDFIVEKKLLVYINEGINITYV